MSNIEKYTGVTKATNAEIVDKKLAAVYRYTRNTCNQLDANDKSALVNHVNEALDDFQDLLDSLLPKPTGISQRDACKNNGCCTRCGQPEVSRG